MSENAVLIPVFRHAKACAGVVGSIKKYCDETKTKIIIVDDGNGAEEKSLLEKIAMENGAAIVRLEKNSGKGEAFRRGMFFARENGIKSVLQLDADGQHDSSRASFFFERAKKNPSALICGFPEYDESAPKHRLSAHDFANLWCAIVTWKRGIVDSLCGFRLSRQPNLRSP